MFQRTRLMERRIEALRSGTLLDHEAADPEVVRGKVLRTRKK